MLLTQNVSGDIRKDLSKIMGNHSSEVLSKGGLNAATQVGKVNNEHNQELKVKTASESNPVCNELLFTPEKVR